MAPIRDLLVRDRFSQHAKRLRQTFDDKFKEPRQAGRDRFVWDYWHIEGQYTALRTPAFEYFDPEIYDAFHHELVWFGRRVLGCHDVSPPWLSCYIEGCVQHLHGDLPHGPFAFVFSLTNWQKRVFRGGETMMLDPSVLDYWHDFESIRSLERGELERLIEPQFNRLVVFDPRIPHGVKRVSGTHEPRDGRLVIHGWFVQPRPFIEGPLKEGALKQRLESTLIPELGEILQRHQVEPVGLLSLSLHVMPTGVVSKATVLCDSLRVPAAQEQPRANAVRAIVAATKRLRFPSARAASRITLPLVLER